MGAALSRLPGKIVLEGTEGQGESKCVEGNTGSEDPNNPFPPPLVSSLLRRDTEAEEVALARPSSQLVLVLASSLPPAVPPSP